MNTASVSAADSVNVLSDRVNNVGPAHGHAQMQEAGWQGQHGDRIRIDAKSADNTIIERRGEENSEEREARPDDGAESSNSDVSSASDLSRRAKEIHGRKKGQIHLEQIQDHSGYDGHTHALDGQLDSLLDSKMSLNSQSRQDLADVKKRISKLLHEPRLNSLSATRSPKKDDTRTAGQGTRRQYQK